MGFDGKILDQSKHCFDQIKAIQEEQASLHSILDNQSAALTSIPPNFKAKSKELNHLFTSKFDIETLDEDSLIYLIFSIFHYFANFLLYFYILIYINKS